MLHIIYVQMNIGFIVKVLRYHYDLLKARAPGSMWGLYETKIQIDKRLQQGLRVTVRRTDITQEEYFRNKELQSKLDCFIYKSVRFFMLR